MCYKSRRALDSGHKGRVLYNYRSSGQVELQAQKSQRLSATTRSQQEARRYLTEVWGEHGPDDTLAGNFWLPKMRGNVSVVFRHRFVVLCHSYLIQLHLWIYRVQKVFKGNQIKQIIDFNWESLNSVLETNKYTLSVDSRKVLISSKLSFSYLKLNQY